MSDIDQEIPQSAAGTGSVTNQDDSADFTNIFNPEEAIEEPFNKLVEVASTSEGILSAEQIKEHLPQEHFNNDLVLRIIYLCGKSIILICNSYKFIKLLNVQK